MDSAALLKAMKKIVDPDRILHNELERRLYSYDSSFLSVRGRYCPDIVVLPRSTAEVSGIMAFACKNGIPVTPRGAGSGETCGCVPARGGIVMDLSGWDTVEEVDVPNMQALVRPGVVHSRLNEHLARFGLFFPPDPGSTRMCTLGGMVANNSSGMRAVKYGTTEQYILGLEVVLPDGEVIVTGGQNCRSLKNASGINLTKIFVGSEGTLGVITLIRLRVWPRPRARGIAMACFDRLEQAPEAVLDVYRAGILPSGIEILDQSAIAAVNLYRPETNLPPVEAILLFEVDGNPASVEWEGREIEEIMKKNGAAVEWSTDPQRMAALWQGRSVVAAAAARLRPDGTRVFAGEDVCVPLGRVAEALRKIKDLGRQYDIVVVAYGHIGDGNIHTALVIDPDNPDEVARLDRLVDEIHRLAIDLGGTTTGEHGVGMVRSAYSPLEHGNALETMRRIKEALDPRGVMNPGKIYHPW
ncbi:MAG: FAD-binding protein [Peptococcaceae bacterium]|nr:FAD-binding protein [Peptococcaceae bacterium]